MIRRPPRSTLSSSSAASDVYKRQGAGYAWNAGNIFGELLGLTPAFRLCLANAVAGYYVSSKRAVHPTVDDLIAFVKAQQLRALPVSYTHLTLPTKRIV